MVNAQREASEAALYAAAVKLLEEAAVLRRLAEARRAGGLDEEAAEHAQRAVEADDQAAQLLTMIRSAP